MTDRDTFAAAALTGLLASPDIDAEPLDCGLLCDVAYEWADAMLRERERTNHDAAPAARAQLPTGDHASGGSGSVGTDNADPLTRWGTGDTQEPVAWGVAHGGCVIATSISRIDAVDMQSDYAFDTAVVPLYRSPTLTATPPLHTTHGACSVPPECTQPTLTDAEREAIGRDLDWLKWCEDNRQIGDVGRKDIATLRGLLERLG